MPEEKTIQVTMCLASLELASITLDGYWASMDDRVKAREGLADALRQLQANVPSGEISAAVSRDTATDLMLLLAGTGENLLGGVEGKPEQVRLNVEHDCKKLAQDFVGIQEAVRLFDLEHAGSDHGGPEPTLHIRITGSTIGTASAVLDAEWERMGDKPRAREALRDTLGQLEANMDDRGYGHATVTRDTAANLHLLLTVSYSMTEGLAATKPAAERNEWEFRHHTLQMDAGMLEVLLATDGVDPLAARGVGGPGSTMEGTEPAAEERPKRRWFSRR